jgi:hypothetical protein
MNRISLNTLLALVLCSNAAWAQTQSIEVRGQHAARTDLHTLCPSAHEELPDALARTAQDVAAHGVVAVQFEIDGSRVQAVRAQGGVGTQARAVQRAVRGLLCSNGNAGRQLVQFNVRFVDPFDRHSRGALALVETPTAQR